jgi:glycosidase
MKEMYSCIGKFIFLFVAFTLFFADKSPANEGIALRSIRASSELAGQDVYKSADNDLNTHWEAAGTSLPQWIEIELDTIYYLTKVQQIFNRSSVWKFIIEGSRNGQRWTTLVDNRKSAAGINFAESVHGYYKYVRLTVLGSSDNYPASSREFSVTGLSEGINILQYHGKIEAMGAEYCEAYKAGDNDISTYWCATGGSYPQILKVDLEKSFYITNIQQVFKDYDKWKYRIEASNDKIKWNIVADKSSGENGCEFNNSIKNSYRYLRLIILGSASGFWANSCEFRIFGYDGNIESMVEKTDSRNLALNVSTAASSIKSTGFSQHNAVDADTTTAWYANETDTFPQWLIVDLKNPCQIDRIGQTFADNDNWKFEIHGSTDKKSWTVLLDASEGIEGTTFSQPVEGSYRYLRLTVLGSDNYVASSRNFEITGFGMPVATRWWQNESGLSRYYTKIYNYILSDITADLDNLKSQGYTILELMCPYKGKADIWGGLGATDNYDIDPSIGTLQDFEELITQAHERNMKILFFGNVGYCRDEAPFFQKACEDEKNDLYSKERNWFHFSETKPDDRWFWSEKAQAYYYSYWGNTDGAAGRIPSYNFNNQEWRDETKKYLRFWADKGLDGLFLDAPEVYDGINDEIIEKYIANTLNGYDFLTNAEGSGDINRWFGRFNYNCIQGFDMYAWGGGGRSEVLSALRENNPSGLNDKLKSYRDKATHMNGITLTPPMWEIQATENERIFETAYLVAMGTLFANHCGDYHYVAQDIIPKWNSESQNSFYALLRMQSSYKGLAPSGQRLKLNTNDDSKYTAFKRTNADGNVSALAIFNFRPQSRSISVNIYNSGIKIPQTPINILSGLPADPIQSANYTVSVPAYGYLILGVENDYGQKTSITGIEKTEPNLRLQVYPNPLVNDLTVKCPHDLKNIKIYSVSGMLLREYNTHNTNSFEINDINLQPGIYILEVSDVNNKKYITKIIRN